MMLAIFGVALVVAAALSGAVGGVSSDIALQGFSADALWAVAHHVVVDLAYVPVVDLVSDAREPLADLAREARRLRDILAP